MIISIDLELLEKVKDNFFKSRYFGEYEKEQVDDYLQYIKCLTIEELNKMI